MEELKTCPFCGSEAGFFAFEIFVTYSVRCKSCGCGTEDGYRTEKEAAEAWNRRIGSNDEMLYMR